MATVSANVINTLGATDIDTKTLTANLVDASKVPRQKLIDASKKRNELAISATATLKNAISLLQQAATDLGSLGNLNKLKIANSDTSSVSVTSGGSGVAIPGNYSIKVNELAAAQRSVSARGFASNSDTVANGFDLALTTGLDQSTVTKTIRVNDGETLASIISKINTSGSDVTARVINTGSTSTPYKILLQGKSGTANAFTISETKTDGSGPVETPIFGDSSSIQVAKDARFELNGIPMTRQSNTVADAVDGLSIQLTKVSLTAADLDVSYDASQLTDVVSNFALAFNNVTDVVVRATGQPKAGDDLAGALQFDSTARSVRNALRGKVLSVSSSRSGDVKTWGDLGITFDRNGTLQVDQAAFNKKFSASPQDAIRALSNNATTPYIYSGSASGLAGDIAVSAYGLLKTGGAVTSMVTSYSNKVDKITTEQSKLDTDMEKLTERYDKQFSALNAVLANFKSTQQRLASMLSTNQNSK